MSEIEWRQLVAEIAGLVGAAQKLVTDHQPDENGRCVTCTTPGRGTPQIQWPCISYALGARALNVKEKPCADS